MTFWLFSAVIVFVFSGLLAMAGLGAAFLFVPFFYYLGVPLAEATPTALLLNVVSLSFATVQPMCIPCSGYEKTVLIER